MDLGSGQTRQQLAEPLELRAQLRLRLEEPRRGECRVSRDDLGRRVGRALVFPLTVRCQGTQVGRQRKAGKLFLKRTGQLQRPSPVTPKRSNNRTCRTEWIGLNGSSSRASAMLRSPSWRSLENSAERLSASAADVGRRIAQVAAVADRGDDRVPVHVVEL